MILRIKTTHSNIFKFKRQRRESFWLRSNYHLGKQMAYSVLLSVRETYCVCHPSMYVVIRCATSHSNQIAYYVHHTPCAYFWAMIDAPTVYTESNACVCITPHDQPSRASVDARNRELPCFMPRILSNCTIRHKRSVKNYTIRHEVNCHFAEKPCYAILLFNVQP